MEIIDYIRNPDQDVKHRLTMAGVALVAAVGLSAMAPQPSDAVVYRICVFAFVLLLIVFRALTMGIWMGQSVDSTDTAPIHSRNNVSHSLSIKPREYDYLSMHQ